MNIDVEETNMISSLCHAQVTGSDTHTHNLVDLKPKTTKNYIKIILLYFIITFHGARH